MKGLLHKRPPNDAQNIGVARALYDFSTVFRIIKIKQRRRYAIDSRHFMPSDGMDQSPVRRKQSGNRPPDPPRPSYYARFFMMETIFHTAIIPHEY